MTAIIEANHFRNCLIVMIAVKQLSRWPQTMTKLNNNKCIIFRKFSFRKIHLIPQDFSATKIQQNTPVLVYIITAWKRLVFVHKFWLAVDLPMLKCCCKLHADIHTLILGLIYTW